MLPEGGILQRGLSSFAGIRFGRTLVMGLVGGILLIALAGDLRGTYRAHMTAEMAKERSRIVLQLNDITLARFAMHDIEKDSLHQAIDAADALNGELVAALAIRTAPDTVIVQVASVDTQFDTTHAGVVRTAFLTDTTDMGIEVTVHATAPPVPAELELGYEIIIPEFNPVIAFIENSEGVFASVSWANMDFQVEAPFFRPTPITENPLRLNVGGRFLVNQTVQLDRLFYATAYATFQYHTTNWIMEVPVGFNTFGGVYSGLGLERNIGQWSGLLDLLWPF